MSAELFETAIVVMTNVSIRLAKLHRSLLKGVPLEEAQTQCLPLLRRQILKSPLEARFAEMRFDPKDPKHAGSDRFVLSKGHAAPILYAAWAEAGAFDRSELMNLRKIDSDLEGHPTPRLPFVDVATGSLGQGICAAVGTASRGSSSTAPTRSTRGRASSARS